MQKFNYHTHTYRCGHAIGDDEQYVKAAIAAGYTTLGFSDHAPYPGVHHPSERMDMDEYPIYLKSIRALKEKYKSLIEIRIGVEIEYFEELNDYYDELRKTTDYLLLGQHNKIPDAYGYDVYCDDEDVMEYAHAIEKALDGKFADLLAHPDYFMLGRRTWNTACSRASHIICEAANRNDIAIEMNLNGIRYGKIDYDGEKRYPYPYREFWKIASEHGCKVVYGVDAHQPLTLLDKGRIAVVGEVLEDIPLNFVEKLVL